MHAYKQQKGNSVAKTDTVSNCIFSGKTLFCIQIFCSQLYNFIFKGREIKTEHRDVQKNIFSTFLKKIFICTWKYKKGLYLCTALQQ